MAEWYEIGASLLQLEVRQQAQPSHTSVQRCTAAVAGMHHGMMCERARESRCTRGKEAKKSSGLAAMVSVIIQIVLHALAIVVDFAIDSSLQVAQQIS